jgi:hypothetical protein
MNRYVVFYETKYGITHELVTAHNATGAREAAQLLALTQDGIQDCKVAIYTADSIDHIARRAKQADLRYNGADTPEFRTGDQVAFTVSGVDYVGQVFKVNPERLRVTLVRITGASRRNLQIGERVMVHKSICKKIEREVTV